MSDSFDTHHIPGKRSPLRGQKQKSPGNHAKAPKGARRKGKTDKGGQKHGTGKYHLRRWVADLSVCHVVVGHSSSSSLFFVYKKDPWNTGLNDGILEDNGLENGEVNLSMELISDAYRQKLKNGF
mgnify:CR=1 FL=1